ncbi:ankyrin repeat protein [Oesophagostomum dentatum]|uniref:Ankyrin repeat protein n=1 Tax=Oesophagostomum dentatum TaxID=61180 RepID=A0A0B1TG54_OESDE|nr:ankyrin repeat protein [Oesophagostomum dentatum]
MIMDIFRFHRDCIDEQDDYGMTPFLRAVSMNALDAVKVLVENHSDILFTDPDGRSAVYIGAKYNAVDVLLYLMDIYRLRQADEGDSYPDVVNLPDHTQDTPMHLVCHTGYMEMVTLLHEHGARIDVMNEDEEIPLHGAAAYGQTACVRQLLEWDKRLVMHRDENSETPLHFAAKNGVSFLKNYTRSLNQSPYNIDHGVAKIDRRQPNQSAFIPTRFRAVFPISTRSESGNDRFGNSWRSGGDICVKDGCKEPYCLTVARIPYK